MHNKLLSLVIFITGLVIGIALTGWDNLKLRSAPLWGYMSLDNNPLLSSRDKDLNDLAKKHSSHDTLTWRIKKQDLLPGGPPKDGIPAIDDPKFDSLENTQFQDFEKIIGVVINGEAKAYPYGILNWHELVNDTVGGVPVTITLCPLCDTNPVFSRDLDGKITTFGVSGKLFQSCLVMYDRATDSLWAQPWGLGIAGQHVNQQLKIYPSYKTTLGKWRKLYPQTTVLSTETGHQRNYFRNPYGDYLHNEQVIFPVRYQQQLTLHPKAIVSYLWESGQQTPSNHFSGEFVSIAHKELAVKRELVLTYKNQPLKVIWDEELGTARFYLDGQEVFGSTAYAFVIPAFFHQP